MGFFWTKAHRFSKHSKQLHRMKHPSLWEENAPLSPPRLHMSSFTLNRLRFALQGDSSPRDWGLIWRTVEKVTPQEWNDAKEKLKQAYQRLDKLFHENKIWNEDTIGGAMAIVVHTAYHLGEIRQALCVLKK